MFSQIAWDFPMGIAQILLQTLGLVQLGLSSKDILDGDWKDINNRPNFENGEL